MGQNNFERMIRLAEDTFAVRNDPSQLDVDQDVIERLQKMHSSTLSEHKDENGPVVWILLIPTTNDLMNEFLQNKITEKELFDKTPIGIPYEALYLCSAMVLPEYRRKGIAKRLTVEAIKNIGKKHRLQNLFVWPFSKEGEILAEEIARLVSIKIFKRKN